MGMSQIAEKISGLTRSFRMSFSAAPRPRLDATMSRVGTTHVLYFNRRPPVSYSFGDKVVRWPSEESTR